MKVWQEMGNLKKKSVAILVFANSSQEELGRKTIPRAGALFNALTKHTLSTVAKSQLPYFHIDEIQQIGSSFGERFVNAIASIFNQGYDKIITIGNDSPNLSVSHLLKAKIALEKGHSVLGPARDGGFYLMGIHRTDFDPKQFKALPWQTRFLIKDISMLLNATSHTVSRLPTFQDIDQLADIRPLLNFINSIASEILSLISTIFAAGEPIQEYSFIHVSPHADAAPFNKGSPR